MQLTLDCFHKESQLASKHVYDKLEVKINNTSNTWYEPRNNFKQTKILLHNFESGPDSTGGHDFVYIETYLDLNAFFSLIWH